MNGTPQNESTSRNESEHGWLTRSRRRVLIQWLGAVAVVAVAVAGLMRVRTQNEPPPPIRVFATSEALRLGEATEILVANCMAERGYSSFPRLPYIVAPVYPTPDRRAYRAWEWDDVELAAESGYSIEPALRFDANQPHAHRREELFVSWLDSLAGDRDAAQAAYGGRATVAVHIPWAGEVPMPADGCIYEAGAKLYGSIESFALVEVYRAETSDLRSSAVSDVDSYQRAETQWAACMATEGYDVRTPLDAYGIAFLMTPEERADEEHVIATADASCNVSTGLRNAGSEAHEHVISNLAREVGEATPRVVDIIESALLVADDILSGDPG